MVRPHSAAKIVKYNPNGTGRDMYVGYPMSLLATTPEASFISQHRNQPMNGMSVVCVPMSQQKEEWQELIAPMEHEGRRKRFQ